jgi:hypothetical protein
MVEHAHGHRNGEIVPQRSYTLVELDSIAFGNLNSLSSAYFHRQCLKLYYDLAGFVYSHLKTTLSEAGTDANTWLVAFSTILFAEEP